jgi:hypothetical protein
MGNFSVHTIRYRAISFYLTHFTLMTNDEQKILTDY